MQKMLRRAIDFSFSFEFITLNITLLIYRPIYYSEKLVLLVPESSTTILDNSDKC